jgi:hypothetical protein
MLALAKLRSTPQHFISVRYLRFIIHSMALTFTSLSRAVDSQYENAPIHYAATAPNDATTALQKRVQAGEITLPRGDGWKLLRALQQHYQIPDASQLMVFSKTSKQNDLISPATPRVIYFSDDAYLGYAVGGSVEVATIDPVLGPVFYVLDPHTPARRPLRFERDQACLSCHGGPFSPDVPGILVRSVTPAPTGHPIMSQGSTVVDTTTPFSERWGGWYVTGKHGTSPHRGNVTAKEVAGEVIRDETRGQNVTDLSHFFDTSPYQRKSSDIVALMVLEHQSSTQNILTKANHTALRAMHMQTSLQLELGEPVVNEPMGTAQRMIDHAVDDVLDALLFKDEAVLPEGGIEGDAAFIESFTATAIRSSEGRSLKDFQLLDRLFKYRCSYLVYGITFRHFTPVLKTRVLRALKEVLTAATPPERYAYLTESERTHIHQLLSQTLQGY